MTALITGRVTLIRIHASVRVAGRVLIVASGRAVLTCVLAREHALMGAVSATPTAPVSDRVVVCDVS